MKHTKSLTQIASVHGHLPGEEETDNKFKVLFEAEQRDRIKWQEECTKLKAELDRIKEIADGFKANFNQSVAESAQMRTERDQLRAQLVALRKYIDQSAKDADKSSKEWALVESRSIQQNAAYRSGMWYAYNDVRNRLPL